MPQRGQRSAREAGPAVAVLGVGLALVTAAVGTAGRPITVNAWDFPPCAALASLAVAGGALVPVARRSAALRRGTRGG